MNPFNQIGLDLQSEILKYNPSYFSVKKHLNQNLFYHQYCDQPISVNEFLSYLHDEQPNQFIIFTETDLPTFTHHFFQAKKGMSIKTLYIEEEDVNEYAVTMTYTHSNVKFKGLKELLNNIDYDKIYFDLKTTFNILSRRNCEQISPGYNKRLTLSIFNEHVLSYDSLNLYSYFDLCKTLIYYTNNYDLLSNQLPRIALHRSDIGEIIFNSEGAVVGGDEEIIQDMFSEYNFKDNIIEMILQL